MSESKVDSRHTHYLLIRAAGIYVKSAELFINQHGLLEAWGREWQGVYADDLYQARRIGIALRRERYPDSHETLGEFEPMAIAWPEARGQ